MTQTMKTVNLLLEGWGVLTCILAISILLGGFHMEKKSKWYFVEVFSCLALNLLANITGILLKGKSGTVVYCILWIADFLEFFFGYLLTFILSLLLIDTIKTEEAKTDSSKKKILATWKLLSEGFFVVAVMLLIVSQFIHMYYEIDANGYYHRRSLFWLSQVIAVVPMVISSGFIHYFRKSLGRQKTILFLVLITAPITAVMIQILIYGIYFALLFAVIAAVLLLVFLLREQQEDFYQTQQKLSQMQLEIVRSQIQPHFLYNSLTAIAQLCEKNPKDAKAATIAFSDYLRMNIKSLDGCRMVPFDEELSHIKTYLYLEQLRFGEDLNVEMEIEETDFCLPALTIQPLVENAVKWGVGQKEDGGTVTLTVKRVGAEIVICITDDGVGMQEGVNEDTRRSHIGMENVKSRLTQTCGGSISVESTLGKGTTVTVTIPSDE